MRGRQTTIRNLLLSVTMVSSLTTSQRAAAYETCSLPSSAWPASDTMDDEFITHWCTDWDALVHFWYALNLNKQGSTWNALRDMYASDCDDNEFGRIMNSGWILDEIWQDLQNSTLPEQQTYAYEWLARWVTNHSLAGWVPKACENQSGEVPVASNPSDGPNKLYYYFFWERDVAQRASTLVHEAYHEIESHLRKGECGTWCDESCDERYGNENAQTIQIQFLGQAAMAYRREPGSSELMVVNFGNDVCGYQPLLSPLSRRRAVDLAKSKLNDCFATGSSFGPPGVWTTKSGDPLWTYGNSDYDYAVDHQYNARWWCTRVCDPEAFIYIPGLANEACNEDYQPENAAINAYNYNLCVASNAEVAAGVTTTERAWLEKWMKTDRKSCIPGYSQDYQMQYCADVSAMAPNVAAIEADWALEDQPGWHDSEEALMDCIGTYCAEIFDPSWTAQARSACYETDLDGKGCLDALCGDLSQLAAELGATSKEYFAAVQCRRHYYENNGSTTAYFDELDSRGVCEWQYEDCVNIPILAGWAAAKSTGDCSLVEEGPDGGTIPGATGVYHKASLYDIATAASYETWSAAGDGVAINACMAGYVQCEATQEALMGLLARLANTLEVPVGFGRVPGWPEPPPMDRVGVIREHARDLVVLASSMEDPSSVMTPGDAARRLLSVPEATHALARTVGQQTFFAVMGAKGRSSVFGPTLVAEFANAAVPIDPTLTRGQLAAIQAAEVGRQTRLRMESATTSALLNRAAESAPVLLFNYAQQLTQATSVGEIDNALDKLTETFAAR